MGHPITQTVTIAAAVSNGIATTQSLGAAGPLTLNGSLVTGGVAVLDAPRRVIITSVGNDSGITWTITGTGRPELANPNITETITGGNTASAPAVSTQDFLTVTSIVGSGATAGNVTAGTNSTASSAWVVWSNYFQDFQVGLVGWVLSGSPTYGVEYTQDDPFGLWMPAGIVFPRAVASSFTNQMTSAGGSITVPCRASRLTISAGAACSVQLQQYQQGN